MVIPWVGFPLANLIKRCEPTSKARFVEFATLHDIGQRQDPLRRAAAASVVDDHWPQAYGFYSNVNPWVAHPKHSQSTEARLPSLFRTTRTQMFNGYADQVQGLYAGMDLRRNY